MTEAIKLAAYVENCVSIKELPPPLLHPSLCVLDAMYSARQNYSSVDDRKGGGVIGRYAAMRGMVSIRGKRLQLQEKEDTLQDLIGVIGAVGHEVFGKAMIENSTRRLGRQAADETEERPYRSMVCLEVAQMLLTMAPTSNTLSGLRLWAQGVDLEDRAHKPRGRWYVKGVGYDVWHYLCMLAGNENMIKPDVHITNFVKCVLGRQPSKREIEWLLRQAARTLGMSPKQLDHSIWSYMRGKYSKIDVVGCRS